MATTPASARDPFPTGLQKLAAGSGIAFAVLLIVSIALGGESIPERDAPLAEWAEYARDQESNLRIGSLVFAIATYEFLWFIGLLRSMLGAAEEAARGFVRITHVVFAGGIVGVSGLALAVALNASVMSFADTPPETLRALSMVSGSGFGLAGIGFATMLVGIGLLNQRIPALPAWIGWLAVANGLTFLLTFGTLLSEDYDNAFGMFFPISYLLLVLFSIAASVVMIKRVGSPGGASSPSASEL